MKVIDLLNKIVNGEEVPDKVKWKDTIYYYSKLQKNYYTVLIGDGEGIGCTLLNDMSYDIDNLNDEVEIIEEENKIPEKLDKYAEVSGDLACEWSFSEKKLKDKINEIIDYLKSKGE